MPEKFPSALVDPATGRVKTFRTTLERLKGDILPGVGWHAAQGLKMAALYFVGGLAAVAAGAASAGLAYYRYRKNLKRAADLRDNAPQSATYDLSNSQGRGWLEIQLGERLSAFGDDCYRMAETAGLETPPKVVLFRPEQEASARLGYVLGSVSDIDGKGAAVMLGDRIAGSLPPPELRARMAGEFARLKLDHTRADIAAGARQLFNTATSLGLGIIGLAMGHPVQALGGVEGFSVAAFISTFTYLAGKSMMGLRARARDAQADRGALLVTGDAEALVRGLRRVRRLRGEEAPSIAEVGGPLGRVLTAVGAAPPPFARRLQAINSFAAAHPAFCEAQRRRLGGDFTAAAAPPETPNPPANPAPSPPAPRR